MMKITVKIDGMMCGMCQSHIADVIRQGFDGVRVKASWSRGQAVIISKADISDDRLQKTIDQTGYRFISAVHKTA